LTHGFASLGEQLQAIARAYADHPRHSIDPRLVRAPTGAGEVDPSGAGFLIASQWAAGLVGFAYEEAVLAPLCDRRPTDAPLADIKISGIDETSRADGSRWGGALAYWSTEGASLPETMPRWKNIAFSPKKLIAGIVCTNELMADAPMLDAHVRRVYAAEAGFKLDLAALAGDGTGKPLGILNSGALITVPKETGQAAQTVVAANIRKMWSRMVGPSRKRAVWLINEDLEEQLDQLANVIGTSGSVPPSGGALYMPAGTGGNPYPLLKGRPVLTMEQCSQLGTAGDIVLADPQHYIIVDGGLTPALSADVKFLTDEVVFRFVLRIDGQSAFVSPITPYNGATNTRSPFVALATRS
jgi:HK97 family phage major capsid protein